MTGTRGDNPPGDRLCSFCRKAERDVRRLIAGPTVFICNECVDVCVDIIADDRVAADSLVRLQPATRENLPDGIWCTLCGKDADPAQALLVENRALVCGPCVGAVALAAGVAQKQPGEPH
jgi:ClpX C4-type zinc finger